MVDGCDDAVGDDGEIGCERCDGDETKVGAGGEEFIGAERWKCVVELVALGEGGGEGWVFEVPYERSGVEEVDGGDADGM